MNETAFESTTDALCAEDLLILERRHELTEHEQRRLNMCLAASDALRILRQLHNDFESFDPEDADDARITDLCASAAKQRFAARKAYTLGRRTRLRMSLIGVSALLLTLAAAAASYRSGFWSHEAERRSLASPWSAPKLLAMSAKAMAGRRAAATTATAHSIRASTNPAPTTLAVGTAKNAVELFSGANAARRAAKTQEAVTLYQRLQAQYPSSDEALVSHVLLARLELGRGAIPIALREFDAYLERAPRGPLTQEALQGRAQALSRLDRRQEEAATWRRLLQEFPNSVYARSAREHLGEGTDTK